MSSGSPEGHKPSLREIAGNKLRAIISRARTPFTKKTQALGKTEEPKQDPEVISPADSMLSGSVPVTEAITEKAPEPETEPSVPEIKPQEAAPRTLGVIQVVADRLMREQRSFPEVKAMGAPAIIATNEAVGDGFFEAVQARDPDGYMIGVGAGNALTMLHCFPKGTIPKGVVLADVNTSAVAAGKMLIHLIKSSSLAVDLQNNFFGMSEDNFKLNVEQLIKQEEDPLLKEAWQKTDTKSWRHTWANLGQREVFSWKRNRAYEIICKGQNIDVVGALLEKFDMLKQLADEDNIGMFYADFTDPAFISTVQDLPGYRGSTNIVYLSNIADHIFQGKPSAEENAPLEMLKEYSSDSKQPIYIDTLSQKLNYFLRAIQRPPKFENDDFMLRSGQKRSAEPEGVLLFADEAA